MRSTIKLVFFVLLISLTFFGCVAREPIFKATAMRFRDTFKRYAVWSEVLQYTYHDENNKQLQQKAIVVFKYPYHTYTLRCFDTRGSVRILDFHGDKRIEHPLEIAQQAETARNTNLIVTYAEFVK